MINKYLHYISHQIKFLKIFFGIVSFFLFLAFSSTAYCTAISSTGAGGNWNAAASWSPAQVPGAGDDVTIAVGSPITINQNINVNSITINGTLTGAAFTFTVATFMTIANGGTFTQNAMTTVTISGATTINGTLTVGNGVGLQTYTGLVTIGATGIFICTASNNPTFTFTNGINCAGTFNKTGTGVVNVAATTVFTNTGAFNFTMAGLTAINQPITISNTSATNAMTFGSAVTNSSATAVTISNSGFGITFSGAFTNNGPINVTNSGTGNITYSAAFTNTATTTYSVTNTGGITFSTTLGNTSANLTFGGAGTGTIAFTGLLTNTTGVVNITGSSPLTFTAGITNSGTINQSGTGAITLNGVQTILNQTAGSVTFSGAVTNSNTLIVNNTSTGSTTFSGATFTNNNPITLNPTGAGSSITISGAFATANTVTLNGSAAINFGSSYQINGAFTTTNNNTLGVSISGKLDGTVAGSTWANAGTSILNYACTTGGSNIPFQTAGTLTNAAGTIFNYSGAGAQDVKSVAYGILSLSGGGTKTVNGVAATVAGELRIYSGTTFELASDVLTVAGTTTVNYDNLASPAVLDDNTNAGSNTFNGPVLVNTFGSITSSSTSTFTFAGVSLTNNGTINQSVAGNITFNNVNLIISNQNSGTMSFTGTVTNSNALTINNTSSGSINFGGAFTNNNTLTLNNTGAGTSITITGAFGTTNNVNLNGTAAISFGGNYTITGAFTTTNNNTLGVTINGKLDGSVAGSTWLNNTSSILNYAYITAPIGPFATSGTLTANTIPNTVNYSGAGAQNIKNVSYYNLTLSGSGNKTALALITLPGNLTIAGTATLADGGFAITVNSNLTNNSTAGAAYTSTGAGSLTITGGSAIHTLNTIAGVGTLANLQINDATYNTILSGSNQSITGNFAITTGTFDDGGNTLNVAGNITNNGTHLSSLGNGTGAINLNGGGSQLSGTTGTYGNLTISGNATMIANATVNNILTLTVGNTLTVGANTLTISNAIGGTGTLSTINTSNLIITGTGGSIVIPSSVTVLNNLTIDNPNPVKPAANLALSGNLTITSNGSFDVNTYTLSVKGNFTNNNSFNAETQTVTLNGTAATQQLGGSATTSFYNLTVTNTSTGVSLIGTVAVTNTMTLTSSLFALNNYNLTLSNALAGSPFGTTKMIITNGTGEYRALFSATGSFTFDVGDNSPKYSKCVFTLTSGTLSSAYVGCHVTATQDPSDSSNVNYIKRYWPINLNGITTPVYNADFYYNNPADISGTETLIKGVSFSGSTRTDIQNPVDNIIHKISVTAQTASLDFAGVDNTIPTPSAPTNTAQTLAGGQISTSTVKTNENGYIYLVKHLTASATQAQLLAAVAANNAFVITAIASTIYTVTVPTTVNDGLYDIVAVDKAWNISAALGGWLTVKNPPTIACATCTSQTYTQSGLSVSILSTAPTITDNGANMQSATIVISANGVVGFDVLSYTGSLTPFYNAATFTLTLTGSDTKANYMTALGNVKFNNTQSPPTLSTRTISFTVTDADGNTSNILTSTLNVVPLNSSPYFISSAVTTAQEWNTYIYNIAVGDVDLPAQTLTITATTIPAWLTFTDNGNRTGLLTGTPPHNVSRSTNIVLQVSDGVAVAVQQSFIISLSKQFMVPSVAATIQAGIDSCLNSDLVLVSNGTYYENIDFKGKQIEVRGNTSTPSSVIINGSQSGSVVTFQTSETSSSLLNGFEITNGCGTLANLRSYNLQNPNNAYYGGGIYIMGASPLLENLLVYNNQAKTYLSVGGSGGGIYCGNNAKPTFNNVEISTNYSQYRGSGICLQNSQLTVAGTGINVHNNTGANYGGGICSFSSTVTLNASSTLQNNSASGVNGLGGGIYYFYSTFTQGGATIDATNAATMGSATTFKYP